LRRSDPENLLLLSLQVHNSAFVFIISCNKERKIKISGLPRLLAAGSQRR